MKKKNIATNSKLLFTEAIFWLAAVLCGLLAVFFTYLTSFAEGIFIQSYQSNPLLFLFLVPIFFLISAALIHFLAPEARGSGIPQVLELLDHDSKKSHKDLWGHKLISAKTAGVKILAYFVALIGGSALGREGPTVHLVACGFAFIGRNLNKSLLLSLNFRAFMTAGASAGVAAAFNAPLTGVTFALEELSDGILGYLKLPVITAIVIAGITAQAIGVHDLYFSDIIYETFAVHNFNQLIVISILGGFFGGGFARLCSHPQYFILSKIWWRKALITGCICAVFLFLSNGKTAGSGFRFIREALENSQNQFDPLFFFEKFVATVFSYLSGIAGGLFAPSLTLGASLGLGAAKVFGFVNFKVCALFGMVSFFSATVQAPLTATVIVMELTGEHAFTLPFFVASLIGLFVSKLIMPMPLYKVLVSNTKHTS